MHHLENRAMAIEIQLQPFASVIDGMALVRKVSHAGLSFNRFADSVLKSAVLRSYDVARSNIVF